MARIVRNFDPGAPGEGEVQVGSALVEASSEEEALALLQADADRKYGPGVVVVTPVRTTRIYAKSDEEALAKEAALYGENN